MKNILFLLLFLPLLLPAQIQEAYLNEDGTIAVRMTNLQPSKLEARSIITQLEGFPKAYVANAALKNFRNLTLADLDGNGSDEIIVGINSQLIALTATGQLWKKELIGTVIYPPTVADINQDGRLEIAVATGGIEAPGRLYLVDDEGKDLTNWPISLNDNWVLNAPVFSDLNDDGQMEIIALERQPPAGNVHILNLDGTSYSPNWPQPLDRTPAVTPSVGDVDGDGEKEIVVFSTGSQYVFNLDGSVLAGYPISKMGLRHSYQSPILYDLNQDARLDIISAGHGDAPEFFVRDYTGNYLTGWPKSVGDWTFTTPSLLRLEGTPQLLMSKRLGADAAGEMLFSWDSQGNLQADFPIRKIGGLEGLISIADIDGDELPELIFGSNLFDGTTQTSFLHAYELDGTTSVAGFPLRPKGWTFMNGIAIGDVNGDKMMDIAVLTYTQNFGAATDSAFVNVYTLDVPYEPSRVWWGTYKGGNDRAGAFENVLSTSQNTIQSTRIQLYPNPASDWLQVFSEDTPPTRLKLYNAVGQLLQEQPLREEAIDVRSLQAGIYFVELWKDMQLVGQEKLIIVRD